MSFKNLSFQNASKTANFACKVKPHFPHQQYHAGNKFVDIKAHYSHRL